MSFEFGCPSSAIHSFSSSPTQCLLPVGECPHLDCLAVMKRVNIRNSRVLPLTTPPWVNPKWTKTTIGSPVGIDCSGLLITSAQAARDCVR